ncbi:dachshund 2 like [Crotalus adamanteus]|uniref:Dachshund 2 like n=1 Tax=Crotalus adamanteus TaxID=8729 RepID=A0AAW1AUD6_CROAD
MAVSSPPSIPATSSGGGGGGSSSSSSAGGGGGGSNSSGGGGGGGSSAGGSAGLFRAVDPLYSSSPSESPRLAGGGGGGGGSSLIHGFLSCSAAPAGIVVGGAAGAAGGASSSLPVAGGNECKMVDLHGVKVASFVVDGQELICLPQVFDLFLKHLVGGLHTVYTKLKRLDIAPVVCTVEQVRILRGLGAIQPGVNRCKLITRRDFETLYGDCTNAREEVEKGGRKHPLRTPGVEGGGRNPALASEFASERVNGVTGARVAREVALSGLGS